jgi:hypothetical protein
MQLVKDTHDERVWVLPDPLLHPSEYKQCRRCRQLLTSPMSVTAGIGPHCIRKDIRERKLQGLPAVAE